MKISLLDNSLIVEVYFEKNDSEYDDNVCISFMESCEEEECIFKAYETNIFLTPIQARELAMALLQVAQESDQKSRD